MNSWILSHVMVHSVSLSYAYTLKRNKVFRVTIITIIGWPRRKTDRKLNGERERVGEWEREKFHRCGQTIWKSFILQVQTDSMQTHKQRGRIADISSSILRTLTRSTDSIFSFFKYSYYFFFLIFLNFYIIIISINVPHIISKKCISSRAACRSASRVAFYKYRAKGFLKLAIVTLQLQYLSTHSLFFLLLLLKLILFQSCLVNNHPCGNIRSNI